MQFQSEFATNALQKLQRLTEAVRIGRVSSITGAAHHLAARPLGCAKLSMAPQTLEHYAALIDHALTLGDEPAHATEELHE